MHPTQQYGVPYDAQRRAGASAVANTMMNALANPYQGAHSSHYAQAYQSAHYTQAYTNYYPNPGSVGPSGYHASPYPQGPFGAAVGVPPQVSSVFHPPPNSSSWYSPGTCRCTHSNCNFIGSAKSLEIHRMDRHLIYPPGWKERKRKPDWDADPSLIGCMRILLSLSKRGC
jgi:hypothetical protein